jgi:uncharacterized protein (TIGR02145 family)
MQNKNIKASALYILTIVLLPSLLHSQVVLGTGTPDGSALLEVQSGTGGVLLPRMTQAQRDGIASPATGLILYNTSTRCLEVNVGTTTAAEWARLNCLPGSIATLNCAGATMTGSLVQNQVASGVSVRIPYTGGNGGTHDGQVVNSTGVTGLTATLSAGNFANGSNRLLYAITGKPASEGTASFVLNIGGQTCTLNITIAGLALNCSSAAITGTLTSGQVASGVNASVPYSGGSGDPHSGQTVSSTGVTGLTATLSAGNFASGSGSLSYAITGTPASGGTASFALNIGGQTCTLNLFVCSTGCCAKVTATEYKNFMCYNLGAANNSADPFTPTWEINGSYWQWGRKPQAAPGPTGSGAGQTNAGSISGWNTTAASSGSWLDGSKTTNDPCPTGFRVPTKAQWDGVRSYNTKTNLGTYSSSATNYGAGMKFGDQLMLPAAGYRNYDYGWLSSRGESGRYWSSREGSGGGGTWSLSGGAWYFTFGNGYASAYTGSLINGLSVRCIAE